MDGRVLLHDVASVWYVFWEIRLNVESQLDLLLREEVFDRGIVKGR